MQLATLCRFLIGDRQAILTIASDRRALGIGLLFVLSAALAREYDGADLLREPWPLLLPFIVSLSGSFLLYLLVRWVAAGKDTDLPPVARPYWPWLACFWMTAPLAWLYAVPFERFLTPLDAARANVATLAIVALWRVALMVRVIAVLTAWKHRFAFFTLMLFATGAVTCITPFSILQSVGSVMAGVRHENEKERLLASATEFVCVGIWAVLTVSAVVLHPGSSGWKNNAPPEPVQPGGSWRGLLVFAVLSVVVWIPILPFTQPEQQLRLRVERAIKERRFADAVAELTTRSRDDFPPGWELSPKRSLFSSHERSILDLLEPLLDAPASSPGAWLRPQAQALFEESLPYHRWVYDPARDGERLARLLLRLPGGLALAEQHWRTVEVICGEAAGLESQQLVNEVRERRAKQRP